MLEEEKFLVSLERMEVENRLCLELWRIFIHQILEQLIYINIVFH